MQIKRNCNLNLKRYKSKEGNCESKLTVCKKTYTIHQGEIMKVIDFLNDYVKDFDYVEMQGGFDLNVPFRLFNDETTLTVHIQENEKGYFDIDDKGRTLKYLENMDTDIDKYEFKIRLICRYFSVRIEENKVKGVIGFGTGELYTQFNNFLQALSNLSMIQLLS